jgi:deoxyribodipyrimidine photo-lyase
MSAVRVEAVDSNGLIPLSTHGRAFTTARSYRAFVQRELRAHLRDFPEEQPLARLPRLRAAVAPEILRRWPPATLLERPAALGRLPIDHTVPPAGMTGGERAARKRLAGFLKSQLSRYGAEHNDPDADCTSRLSPYLHFGHISAHEVFSALMTSERWTTRKLAARGGGAREGWWGVSDSANMFLDQLIVWRELAFNGCEWVPDFTRYESLPQWARDTIDAHRADPRRRYDFDTLDAAATHDPVWNATQRQLKAEGWFHGYLRMLWGKKLFEWAPDAPTALLWMEALMNRYSLDGRDPVSYAGFTWVLGRYDRPWPRRPVFGTLRYMSSDSAKRKLRMTGFLSKYAAM